MADTNLLILAREFKKLRTDVREVLQMPVGPQGLQGEKGEKGDKGETGSAGRDGKDGINGKDGVNGLNGANGKDGSDGKDGKDGISVVDARVDFDGSLVLTLSDGNEIDAGKVSTEQAENVYAMLKNGAASLNELLPSQTGQTGKVLATDGSTTYWTTAGSGGGSGTVTSVALSAPVGFSVSGSPVTTMGTLALSFSAGYSLPTTSSQGQWDTAYGWGNHASAGYLTSSAIGTTVQAYSATLTTWASKTAPSGTVVGTTDTQTLTNKNITERVVSIANATSITINADITDLATQANTQATGTLTINAPTGTPVDGQKLMLRLQSTNVQTFSWNAIFAGSTDLVLPSASSGSSKYDYVGFIYNGAASKWQLVAKNFGF